MFLNILSLVTFCAKQNLKLYVSTEKYYKYKLNYLLLNLE